MIRAQLEKLAFQKLKVQQITLLKQKLVGSIRGICKGAPGASIRNFQSNPLAIADTAKKNAGKIAEQTQERAKTAAIKGYDEKKSEDVVQDYDDVTVQGTTNLNVQVPKPKGSDKKAVIKKDNAALKMKLEGELAKMEAGEYRFFMRRSRLYDITRDPADKHDIGTVSAYFDLGPWVTHNTIEISELLRIEPVKYVISYLSEKYGTNRDMFPSETNQAPRTLDVKFLHKQWDWAKLMKQEKIDELA